MPVPPKHRSRSKKRRGWAHLALKKTQLFACTHCKKMIVPHQACPFCGYYKGKEVVSHRVKKEKKQHEH